MVHGHRQTTGFERYHSGTTYWSCSRVHQLEAHSTPFLRSPMYFLSARMNIILCEHKLYEKYLVRLLHMYMLATSKLTHVKLCVLFTDSVLLFNSKFYYIYIKTSFKLRNKLRVHNACANNSWNSSKCYRKSLIRKPISPCNSNTCFPSPPSYDVQSYDKGYQSLIVICLLLVQSTLMTKHYTWL